MNSRVASQPALGKLARMVLATGTATLAACGNLPSNAPPPSEASGGASVPSTAVRTPSATRKPQVVLKRGGGFYKDDGPGEEIPDGLDEVPDAEPRWEPLHKPAQRPYVVLGREYVPNTAVRPYKARGIASWYGKKFHGQKTSIGEPYDMFAMTAAHPTLALPTYVRVTHVQSGKAVVVRVIDRGPFHADRIIDLSYTAAYKLGLVQGGSGLVEVEALLPGESAPRPLPSPERDEIEEFTRRLAREEASTQTVATESALRGVYLQLGAFGNADNAETLKNHLSRELDWLTDPMRIVAGKNVHRLQLGPYANRADAEKIAERIRLALGYRPTFVIRP